VNIPDQRTRDDAVVIALGSNMAGVFGTPDEAVARGIRALGDNGITVTGRSRLWRSKAWPDPKGPEYRNAVALVETKMTPASLMRRLHAIERTFGRERGAANAPRVLDLDLIAYGRMVSPGPPVLPHPRAVRRRFVMGPLAELLPDWTDPIGGKTAAALAGEAEVGRDAEPL
jgi:2-amino-4-hydroxy-6-hydroxymethyldihydropteridine diphosphokinase